VVFTPTSVPFGQSRSALPLSLAICQTNSQGQCINPTSPAVSSTLAVAKDQTVFFSIFAFGQGTSIPYDPANNRVFMIATQGSTPVGEASAAVKMQCGRADGRGADHRVARTGTKDPTWACVFVGWASVLGRGKAADLRWSPAWRLWPAIWFTVSVMVSAPPLLRQDETVAEMDWQPAA
jgi:hypothetical protein